MPAERGQQMVFPVLRESGKTFGFRPNREPDMPQIAWNGTSRGSRMKTEQLLERIVIDPKVMAGKPVIRGTRLTVEYILNLLAHGETVEEILGEYKELTHEDVRACLLFATRALESTEFMPLTVEST